MTSVSVHAARNRLGWMRWGAALAALALLASTPSDAAKAEPVAIVHPDNPTASLSIQQLRLMYALYKRSWKHGERIDLVLPPSDREAMDFLVTRVFRKTRPDDIAAYYVDAVFRQKIPKAPRQLGERDAIAFVASHPGAIAIIDRSDLTSLDKVRIVAIDD